MNIESLNVEQLENLSHAEQIKVKKEVINNFELENIPIVFLPDVITKEYYFVSYSHKNYKEVYSDLFDLSEMGLAIWYDRGIPAGSNWKDTAIKYLAPFDCKGVIFYISEEALVSDAIKDEIKFTQENDKPFIVIFLSEEKSLGDLLTRLSNEDKISKEDYEFYKNVFPNEVIYLKYTEPKQTKYEKIINGIPKQNLLCIDVSDTDFSSLIQSIKKYENGPNYDSGLIDEVELVVNDINDHYATKITVSDFLDTVNILLENKVFSRNVQMEIMHLDDSQYVIERDYNKHTDEIRLSCVIDNAAFSHLNNLEFAELPTRCTICNSAFFGCRRLKEVKFVHFTNQRVSIGDYAFANCTSLEKIDLSNVVSIGYCAFANCIKLSEVSIGNNNSGDKRHISSISNNAFEGCYGITNLSLCNRIKTIGYRAFPDTHIEKLILPRDLEVIEEEAFTGSCRLKELVFNEKLRIIEDGAFSFAGIDSNQKLEIHLPKSLEKIGQRAFIRASLGKITYDGTADEFMKIAGDNFEISDKKDDISLVCLDKTILIKESY